MSPTVIKVGGSVLRSAEAYAALARKLATHIAQGPTWVVVSAPLGVTERLLRLASRDDAAEEQALLREQAQRSGTRSLHLASILHRGLLEARAGRPDALLAWGEQASAAALARLLADDGLDVPVVELSARARPPPLDHAIVPGFFLRDRRGRARLLPRGGSDISALLLAHWLGAGTVRLWKDGGGIREGSVAVPRVTAASLRQRLGRTIHPLHPAALGIAQRHGISLVLEDPWGIHPSTVVDPGAGGRPKVGLQVAA
ncbi:MAG TPA: hypothetical protein VM286_00065 [Candidatus Thermoplasmatota archaeon]|nr:hypothetical protein [Candidatus Thermoplasmatota archaeon]